MCPFKSNSLYFKVAAVPPELVSTKESHMFFSNVAMFNLSTVLVPEGTSGIV